jgi:hypothetical protein
MFNSIFNNIYAVLVPFSGGSNPEYPENTIDRVQVTDELHRKLYRVHLTKYQNGTHDYGLMFSW